MAISINSNLPSLQADRQIIKKSDDLKKSFDKLSSGLRITKASDDPAGLAIAVDLLTNANIDDVAMRNVSDAVSAANIAEGSISSASDIVTRMGELATQASNGTLSSSQRSALNNEYQSLRGELDRLASSTEFNGQQLLSGSSSMSVQAGDSSASSSQLQIAFPGVSSASLGLPTDIATQANAESAIDQTKTATSQLASSRGSIGATVSRLDTAFENLRSAATNIRDAASQIRDADIAQEVGKLTAAKIGQEAAMAIKAQANVTPQLALRLLQ
jgi:flagellin